MKVLGIDIGSYSIKVAELDASGSSYAIANFIEFPLSADLTRDRSLEIIEILRNLSSQYDPSSTRFIIGVPQHRVSVHQRKFPFRERQKILKSLAFELEDDIPLDMDETVFDAKIVEFADPMSEVLTVAAPKEAIEEVLSLAKDGGFDPEIVSVEGLALSNIFEAWNSPPPEAPKSVLGADEVTNTAVGSLNEARLVLQLGHTRSLLLAYRGTVLLGVRSIQWGGAEIAEAIARVFSLPFFEAVKVLQKKSFILMNSAGATRDQLMMSKTVSSSVDNLVRELRLTVLELKSAFGFQFNQIELLGGTSQIQNLGAYLTQNLEIPANIARHLAHHRQVRFEATAPLEAISGVAIGLAIEGLKRPRNPAVNLRKDEFARENLTLKNFWEKWRIAGQVAMAAFAIFFVFSIVRETLSLSLVETVDAHLTEMAGKVAGLKGSNASPTGVQRYIRTQTTLIRNRESLAQLDNYNSSMDVLLRLSEKLPISRSGGQPSGVDVTHLLINNDDGLIEGRIQNASLASSIEAALNQVARPKSVTKTPPTAAGSGPGTPFAYKFKVNRKP